MAKKIYNKNAREAHLMAEAYQSVVNEERITDVFYKYVDKIEQDIYNGMTFKESMISNKIDPSHWNNLLDIYTEYMEDKTEGPFETGFEDAEGDWAENTPAGREDGNEPDNRNILGINWYDIDPETHKMLSMAEDLLGNLDDSGYGELAQRGISGVDDNYDDDAIDMLSNLQDQGWTTGSKAWKLSRKIVDFGLDGLASEDAEISEDVDHISEAIKEMIKTFLDDDKFEGGLQDAFDLTIEQIGDSLGYYTIDNIGL